MLMLAVAEVAYAQTIKCPNGQWLQGVNPYLCSPVPTPGPTATATITATPTLTPTATTTQTATPYPTNDTVNMGQGVLTPPSYVPVPNCPNGEGYLTSSHSWVCAPTVTATATATNTQTATATTTATQTATATATVICTPVTGDAINGLTPACGFVVLPTPEPTGTAGQIQGYNASSNPEPETVTGDTTFSRTGANAYSSSTAKVNGNTPGNSCSSTTPFEASIDTSARGTCMTTSTTPQVGALGIGASNTNAGTLQITASSSSVTPINAENDWGSVSATHQTAIIDGYGDLPRFTLRRADGSKSSPTGLVLNDVLGNFGFRGYQSGGAFGTASTGALAALATETFTSSAQGTKFVISTTPNGSTTAAIGVTVWGDSSLSAGSAGGHDPAVTGAIQTDASYYKGTTPVLTSNGICQGTTASIAANTTDFISCGQLAQSSLITSEANAQSIAPCTGVLSNLYAVITTTGNTNRAVVTVDDNTVGTTLTCTIASSGTTCNDTTDHPTLTAGHLYSVKLANPASANSTGIVQVGYQMNCGG